MKKFIISISVLLLMFSCVSNNQENLVMWVSGFKAHCDSGTGSSQCLLISKEERLENAKWQVFYDNIEDFQFEDGVLKKIEVLETERDAPIPADTSRVIYKMTKVLEQQPDLRIGLNGDWNLQLLLDEPLDQDTIVPTLSINLSDMTVNGSGGCNLYNGAITSLGFKTMAFGEFLNTLKMCEHQVMEDKFLKALRETAGYEIANNELSLVNNNNEVQLVFKRMDKTNNSTRLNDIWAAVRIDGNPINRMVEVPRLEVNLSEMKIFGSDGCNNYFGTILELTEETIAFGGVGSTRKMCPDMEVPQHYNEALSKIHSYGFDKQLLILKDRDGNEVLAFLKTD
jgi:heat shock protein HslJ